MKKANARRLSELKFSNDPMAIDDAVANGEISARQAQNMLKFMAAVTSIREHPPQSVPIQDERGQFVGEVRPLSDGSWLARPYGPEFKTGGTVFDSADEAQQYVESKALRDSGALTIELDDGASQRECAATAESASSSACETDRHYAHSVLRERIVEHVFVGEMLRRLWQRGITDVEVLRSEFDAGGYDLVLSHQDVVRHIQMKTALHGGRADSVTINMKLAQKPSGCVLWIVVDDALAFRTFRWFGDLPGKPLPDLQNCKGARHTRAGAGGIKHTREGHKVLRRREFVELETLDALMERLFGNFPPPLPDRLGAT